MDEGFKEFMQYILEITGQMERMTYEQRLCTTCGTSYHTFRKSGKLGCAACYDAFRESMAAALVNIHGSSDYMGKIPSGQAHKYIDMQLKRELDENQRLLKRALDAEEFGLAAKYRDIISELLERVTHVDEGAEE